MNERIDELSKIIDFLKEENKRIEDDKFRLSGYEKLIAQNRKYILKFEQRVEDLEEELFQVEKRMVVEEMR
jgi:predicted  nucleic acid-binding Zn-ribbon protein|tara:strand:+ start:7637 stop:7849 length:213 start_codon:yes stop_codon:yes gene_type:complete